MYFRPFAVAALALLCSFFSAPLLASVELCGVLLARAIPNSGDAEEVREYVGGYAGMVGREAEAFRTRHLGAAVPATTQPIVRSIAGGIVMKYATGADLRPGEIYDPVERAALLLRLERLQAATRYPDSLLLPLVNRELVTEFLSKKEALAVEPPPQSAVAFEVPAPPPPAAAKRRWFTALGFWKAYVAAQMTAATVAGGALGYEAIGALFTSPKPGLYAGMANSANARERHLPMETTESAAAAVSAFENEGSPAFFHQGRFEPSDFQGFVKHYAHWKGERDSVQILLGGLFGSALAGFGAWPLTMPTRRWISDREREEEQKRRASVSSSAVEAEYPAAAKLPRVWDDALVLPELREMFELLSDPERLAEQTEGLRFRHVGVSFPERHFDIVLRTQQLGSSINVTAHFIAWMGPLDFWPPGRTARDVTSAELGGGARAENLPRYDVRAQLEAARSRLAGMLPKDMMAHEPEARNIVSLFARAQKAGFEVQDAMAFVALAAKITDAENLAPLEDFLSARGK